MECDRTAPVTKTATVISLPPKTERSSAAERKSDSVSKEPGTRKVRTVLMDESSTDEEAQQAASGSGWPQAEAPPPQFLEPAQGQNNGADQKGNGCLRKMVADILQQKEASSTVPLWGYRPVSQVALAAPCAVLFIILGAVLLSAAGRIVEVEAISYSHGDYEKEFSVDTQIDSDVLVYYDLPEIFANRKQFIENKDPDTVHTMLNKVGCLDAEDQDALWRRGCLVEKRRREGGALECPLDPDFADLVNSLGNTRDFKPCGLVALSMFIDEFQFAKEQANGQWSSWIDVDETDVALEHEVGARSGVFGTKIVPDGSGGFTIGEDKIKSWLKPGPFFEHFKVWYRPPASPHVRNLWGRIRGPLEAGRYKVRFTKNSAIWTQAWGLPEKRIVLMGQHTLGSKGACKVLGAFSLLLGLLEALMAIAFVVFAAKNR